MPKEKLRPLTSDEERVLRGQESHAWPAPWKADEGTIRGPAPSVKCQDEDEDDEPMYLGGCGDDDEDHWGSDPYVRADFIADIRNALPRLFLMLDIERARAAYHKADCDLLSAREYGLAGEEDDPRRRLDEAKAALAALGATEKD